MSAALLLLKSFKPSSLATMTPSVTVSRMVLRSSVWSLSSRILARARASALLLRVMSWKTRTAPGSPSMSTGLPLTLRYSPSGTMGFLTYSSMPSVLSPRRARGSGRSSSRYGVTPSA